MSITNFLTTVWSETLLNSLEKEYVAARNCNREFEGDFKSGAGYVKVCGINGVSVFPYSKNMSIGDPEVLKDSSVILTALHSRAFNFIIDDIDLAQSRPNIMKAAMKEAANALANESDKYIFSLHSQMENTSNIMTFDAVSESNIIPFLISIREKMVKNNVNSNTKTVLEVSPEIASKLLLANIMLSTNNDESLHNGYLGSFVGFDIYVSNNIECDESGYFKCYARTKRAIAFVEQINSVEAYRPENHFADAVKGLYVYGAKILYPEELLLINMKPE